MFNLLPEQEKAALRREYRYRQAFVWCAALATALAIAIGLLLPSYIFSITRNQTLKIEREAAARTAERNVGTATEVVAEAERLSAALSAIPDARISAAIAQMIAVRPEGVVILRFAFAAPLEDAEKDQENKALSAEVQGVARNREALRSYARALEQEPSLDGVDVPIESFTRETNIPFTLTMSVSNQ